MSNQEAERSCEEIVSEDIIAKGSSSKEFNTGIVSIDRIIKNAIEALSLERQKREVLQAEVDACRSYFGVARAACYPEEIKHLEAELERLKVWTEELKIGERINYRKRYEELYENRDDWDMPESRRLLLRVADLEAEVKETNELYLKFKDMWYDAEAKRRNLEASLSEVMTVTLPHAEALANAMRDKNLDLKAELASMKKETAPGLRALLADRDAELAEARKEIENLRQGEVADHLQKGDLCREISHLTSLLVRAEQALKGVIAVADRKTDEFDFAKETLSLLKSNLKGVEEK